MEKNLLELFNALSDDDKSKFINLILEGMNKEFAKEKERAITLS